MEASDLAAQLRCRGLVAVHTDGADDGIVGGRRVREGHAGINVYEQSFVVFRASDGWRLVVSRVGAVDLDVVLPDLPAVLIALVGEYGLA